MRSIPIDCLAAEMVVGRNIYSGHGLLLLGSGVPLTVDLIERIRSIGIGYVYIDDEDTEGIVAEDAVPQEVRAQAVGLVQDTFEHVASQPGISPARLRVDLMTTLVKDILDGLREHPGQVFNVVSIKTYDEYTYQHSANVAILAMIVGRSMNLDEGDLITLGVGALLHDLGKTQIPLDILNKPGRLTPEEFAAIKTHPRLGFNILKKDWGISPLSANVALSHHERLDGTGYPIGREGEEIPLYSRITAAADVYDALTSVRPYRVPMSPDGAIRLLQHETYDHLYWEPVDAFSRCVTPYPVGYGALLSNRFAGVIAGLKEEDPFHPTIRMLYEPGGGKIGKPFDYETGEDGAASIVEVTNNGSAEGLAKMTIEEKAA